MKPTNIHRREWLVALLIAFLLAALLVAPYIIGRETARPGTFYTGLLINVEDGTYLSAIEQGRQGNWLFSNHFTPERSDATFLYGFFLLLGHLARWVGLSATAMWLASLFLSSLALFVAVYFFLAHFLVEREQRLVAFLLIALGSGFDFFRFPEWLERAGSLEAVPVDLLMPEAHPFFSALTYPHFSIGIALIALTLLLAALALEPDQPPRRRWLLAAAAGVANLVLVIVYPFLIILIGLTLGLYYLVRLWRARRLVLTELLLLALVFLIPAPLLIYYVQSLAANPILRAWNAQAVTLSPNPLHFVLAYLPYLALALAGIRLLPAVEPRRRQGLILLWLWVVAVGLLLYAPLNPQRRFVEGVQVPLAILATVGLYGRIFPWLVSTGLFQRLAQRPRYSAAGLRRFILVLLILLTSVINLYLYSATLINMISIQPYPLFRPIAEREAMEWLGANTSEQDVVLGSYWTGSYLPYAGGRPVVVGSRYMTIDFFARLVQVERFFDSATTQEERLALLAQNSVDYIFWGQVEQAMGPPAVLQAPYLEPVFANERVTIFRVRGAGEPIIN
jgi:hypothetical protein